ncbi:hypothetical protein K438DRAFT_1758333 [Mycena galopus ATCC 62051]|nr:hypothetical protein K438DRAFT_1758333 [Mycena galopus ATCC 62051]
MALRALLVPGKAELTGTGMYTFNHVNKNPSVDTFLQCKVEIPHIPFHPVLFLHRQQDLLRVQYLKQAKFGFGKDGSRSRKVHSSAVTTTRSVDVQFTHKGHRRVELFDFSDPEIVAANRECGGWPDEVSAFQEQFDAHLGRDIEAEVGEIGGAERSHRTLQRFALDTQALTAKQPRTGFVLQLHNTGVALWFTSHVGIWEFLNGDLRHGDCGLEDG